MAVRLREGLRVEEIDGEAVVLDRDGATAHRFTGDAVEALRLLAHDVEPSEVPEHLVAAFDEVVASGVVANPAFWTRRKVLMAGGAAAWTAATVSSFGLSLPAAAQAASTCPGSEVSDGAVSFTMAGGHTYTTGPGQTTLLVRSWGGGGGGAGGNYIGTGSTGSGGGGGQYSYNEALPVSPCAMYTVTVGNGGVAGSMAAFLMDGGPGAAGGVSYFAANTTFAANGGSGGMNGGGNNPPGGSGGTPGTGGISNPGGEGGADASGRGGGGGGAGGNEGPGGAGAPGPGGVSSGMAAGGTGGAGTPGGGQGGEGAGGLGGDNATAGAAPGGGGGGGGGNNNGAAGAAGAVWVDI